MTIIPLTEEEKAFREEIRKSLEEAGKAAAGCSGDSLLEEIDRLKAIIAGLEWVEDECGPVCIVCGASKKDGHNDGCWLGRSIKLILGND